MARVLLVALVVSLSGAGAMFASPALPLSIAVDASAVAVQSVASRIGETFAAAANEILGLELVGPSVEVLNTPQLAFFNPRVNRIVVPHWPTLDSASQAFFLERTQTESEAAELFVALFDEFLVVHEMSHWLQWNLDLKRDLYTLETEANDLAVAFFMACEGGEEQLMELESMLATGEPLPNPTPDGVDEVDFFNSHYAELAADPARYGYYQVRFILDSISHRDGPDFATSLTDLLGEGPQVQVLEVRYGMRRTGEEDARAHIGRAA